MQYRSTPPQQSSSDQIPISDVYSIVTSRIIDQLEKGTVPWQQPWADAGIPRNFISRRPYRGINIMLLSCLGYEHNLFLTHNQLQELGGHVRKGEKAHMAIFWNYIEVSVSDKSRDNRDDKQKADSKKVPYLRYYSVFNIAQCEGIPAEKIPSEISRVLSPIPFCEEIAEKMPLRPLIKQSKEQRAYYNPMRDYVNMPKFSSFDSAESYYATLFHELVHSTGHHSRLNRRDLMRMEEFNREEAYSHEELVAEIGSCYLLSFAGVTSQIEQSAGYIDGWLGKLRGDRKFIFSAATGAQKATDYILNLPGEVLEEKGTPVKTKPKPDNKSRALYFNTLVVYGRFKKFIFTIKIGSKQEIR